LAHFGADSADIIDICRIFKILILKHWLILWF